MIKEKVHDDLIDIVGEEHFSDEEYLRELYSQDIAALPGIVNDILNRKTEAVVQPTSVEMVSSLLKYCSANGIPMVPRGHGTSGYGGAIPAEGGIVIELARLDDVYSINKQDMTVEVGAGITWKQLLEALETEGLTLAAYPSSAPSSTVGGWVASGGTGIGCTKYGGIREQVIELEVVLANGRIISTTDVPNDIVEALGDKDEFSENDITSLFIGSSGALAIVTKAVLKIIPYRKIRSKLASFQSESQMFSALQDLSTETHPFFLHFVNDSFYQMLNELGKAPDTKGDWVILSTFEGTDEEIEQEIATFNTLIPLHGGFIENDKVAEHEWDERFYPMRIKRLGPSIAPSEVYIPLEELENFTASLNKHFKRERFAIEGSVTNKGEVAVLTWFLDDERRRISFLMGWHRSLDVVKIGLKYGGRAYSVGMWLAAYSKSHFGEETYNRMVKLKKITDPKNVLNSHKVFPGSLNLSLRMNLLILTIGTLAVPAVLSLIGMFYPYILDTYLPFLNVQTLSGLTISIGLGFFLGAAVAALINRLSVSFMLSIGAPFLRLGRRIFH
ncbi:MAG: FAD-binding protein [Candidatus Thorarchaeota archaeon]|jgi:FAD/FMN-containing dehydrogenase